LQEEKEKKTSFEKKRSFTGRRSADASARKVLHFFKGEGVKRPRRKASRPKTGLSGKIEKKYYDAQIHFLKRERHREGAARTSSY